MANNFQEIWDRYIVPGASVMKKVKMGTALDPILVLVFLVSIPSLVIFVIYHSPWALVTTLLPVLYFMRAYDYLLKHDRSKLRSEAHEERRMLIAAGMGEKLKEKSEELIDITPKVVAHETTTSNPKLVTAPQKRRPS